MNEDTPYQHGAAPQESWAQAMGLCAALPSAAGDYTVCS